MVELGAANVLDAWSILLIEQSKFVAVVSSMAYDDDSNVEQICALVATEAELISELTAVIEASVRDARSPFCCVSICTAISSSSAVISICRVLVWSDTVTWRRRR